MKIEMNQGILGNSKSILNIKEKLDNLKTLNVPVLILGESGTGKDFFIQYLNSTSELIKLHSEEFFTELRLLKKKNSKLHFKDKYLELNQNIYFDRIELLTEEAQAVLFKIVERRELNLAEEEKIIFNGRFFFSAEAVLLEKVKELKFRKDLFQKLQLVRIDLPNLKDRKEDIPFFVNYYMNEFNRKYKKKIHKLTPKLLDFFRMYDYPGNISELRNLLEGMILLSNSKELDSSNIPKDYLKTSASLRENKFNIIPGIQLSEYEKEIIIQNLKFTHNNRERAAHNLGISVRTLYRKIKEYGLN
jgi:DNA-binding NtrC family response regulator